MGIVVRRASRPTPLLLFDVPARDIHNLAALPLPGPCGSVVFRHGYSDLGRGAHGPERLRGLDLGFVAGLGRGCRCLHDARAAIVGRAAGAPPRIRSRPSNCLVGTNAVGHRASLDTNPEACRIGTGLGRMGGRAGPPHGKTRVEENPGPPMAQTLHLPGRPLGIPIQDVNSGSLSGPSPSTGNWVWPWVFPTATPNFLVSCAGSVSLEGLRKPPGTRIRGDLRVDDQWPGRV